jgi:hypothetical protein
MATENTPITLGELIKQLEKCKPETEVRFDFVYMVPTRFRSYRGFYAALALGYGNSSDKQGNVERTKEPTVAELLELCYKANGEAYEGYKGGTYYMNNQTPVWVANYGEVGNTAIVSVLDQGWQAILLTSLIQD